MKAKRLLKQILLFWLTSSKGHDSFYIVVGSQLAAVVRAFKTNEYKMVVWDKLILKDLNYGLILIFLCS